MEFTADRQALADVIRYTRSDVSCPESSLNGRLLLRLTQSELTVTGRDGYVIVAAALDVSRAQDGAACVDWGRLDEFLHRSRGDEVVANLVGTRLRLRAGGAAIELPSEVRNTDLPVVPKARAVTIPARVLLRLLETVVQSSHTDPQHPVLWGVHLESDGNTISATACDGQRFARATESLKSGPLSVVLNRTFALKLTSVLSKDDEVSVKDHENSAYVRIGVGRQFLFGLKRPATYPNVTEMMSAATSWRALVMRHELLEAIDLVRIADEEAAVKVDIGETRCLLSVKSADGNASHPIPCRAEGPRSSRVLSLRALRAASTSIAADVFEMSGVETPYEGMRLETQDGSAAWLLAARVE